MGGFSRCLFVVRHIGLFEEFTHALSRCLYLVWCVIFRNEPNSCVLKCEMMVSLYSRQAFQSPLFQR